MSFHISGSCLCKRVSFEVSGKPITMGYCHCSRCRKAGGSAGLVNIVFRKKDFSWTGGENLVSTFEDDPPFELKRSFCRNCGAYLGEPYCDGDFVVLAASTLDGDPGIKPRFHEHTADKASWYEITDGIKQFEGDPDSTIYNN